MKTTCTNGNARNSISGSRIRVWAELTTGEVLVDEFEVPRRNGVAYCEQYRTGQYGRRYDQAMSAAVNMEAAEFYK